MVDKQPLTKKDLLEVLKEMPTEKSVDKIVIDASHTVLEGVGVLLKELREEMNSRFDKLETGHKELQRQINDLKCDTPTKKEFKELEDRVGKYHPVV